MGTRHMHVMTSISILVNFFAVFIFVEAGLSAKFAQKKNCKFDSIWSVYNLCASLSFDTMCQLGSHVLVVWCFHGNKYEEVKLQASEYNAMYSKFIVSVIDYSLHHWAIDAPNVSPPCCC